MITRGLFEVLAEEPGGLPLGELHERVYRLVPPNHPECENPASYLGVWTTGLVKAQWIRKGRAGCGSPPSSSSPARSPAA